ncbi:hypothetical protein Tco_1556895 [Tanacetum coccineum]
MSSTYRQMMTPLPDSSNLLFEHGVRHDIACTLEKWECYVKNNFTFSVTQGYGTSRHFVRERDLGHDDGIP